LRLFFGWLHSALLWLYSSLLAATLILGAPYWLFRMATSGRYRAGLAGRLGRIPATLKTWAAENPAAAPASHPILWLHAVSVGEVLVAARIVEEFARVLPSARFAVSTTTATGQALAQQRLPNCAVFYLPLDFRYAVRCYLNLLQPDLLVLIESELWPNLIAECAARRIPIAVANARISDRSFPRYLRLRRLWQPIFAQISLFLAQSAETAARLRQIAGPVLAARVHSTGNIKYDARAPQQSRLAELIREAAAGRPILIAGSTLGGDPRDEEASVIQAWKGALRSQFKVLLVLAPRHPDRFSHVHSVALEFPTLLATEMLEGKRSEQALSGSARQDANPQVEILVLDTIGDLAALYALADAAFIGGSLVSRGGHNPLEPAQFAVPVLIGPSYENFREIVETMRAADGIRIVQNKAAKQNQEAYKAVNEDSLEQALAELLTDRPTAQAIGLRGQSVFAAQSGATARTVAALLNLIPQALPPQGTPEQTQTRREGKR
jgi:3-deoxy-D-manno-octulosonic-acid transferase